MLRVLQVLPSLDAGGAEGFVTNLGVALSRLGAEVRFFLLGGARGTRGQVLLNRLKDHGIVVIGEEIRRPASLQNLARLLHVIRSWRPQIVQSNLYGSDVACAAARVLNPIGNVCFVRRLANTDLCSYRNPVVVKLVGALFPLTIACSPAVAETYLAFMGRRRAGRVITIPNGGFLRQSIASDDERSAARKRLGVSEAKFIVTHVGRMQCGGTKLGGGLETGQKAHDVLLKAFARAFAADDTCHLLLVGDGPLRGEAEELAQTLGIRERTHFLGVQPEPWPAMLAADAFCFPSRHEGLPNVLLEAASCGLPVVASDIPEIRYLRRGDGWLLAPVDDVEAFSEALVRLRDGIEEYRCRAGQAASEFAQEFSMESCAKRYLHAYTDMLGGNPDQGLTALS